MSPLVTAKAIRSNKDASFNAIKSVVLDARHIGGGTNAIAIAVGSYAVITTPYPCWTFASNHDTYDKALYISCPAPDGARFEVITVNGEAFAGANGVSMMNTEANYISASVKTGVFSLSRMVIPETVKYVRFDVGSGAINVYSVQIDFFS